MTSPAKIAANRRNARRSTGPRSAAGKARARRNAFRHGLATPGSLDHVAMDRIDNLVDALTIHVHSQLQIQLATVAAEAQAEIERVRRTKVNLVNRASAQLREEGAGLLSAGERAALAFAGKTEILMACERYERRAISRRNRALHALAKLQRELRREEAIEVVGPPRPKSSLTRHNPFRENVLRLQVEKLMGSAPRGRVNFSSTFEWHFIKNIYGEPGKSTVGVYVTADDHHGFLHLRFEVNGEPIAQTFELACKAMRVGGVRWTVKCPESGKMVRDLTVAARDEAHAEEIVNNVGQLDGVTVLHVTDRTLHAAMQHESMCALLVTAEAGRGLQRHAHAALTNQCRRAVEFSGRAVKKRASRPEGFRESRRPGAGA